ncbi:hypothetical protein ASG17_13325 [Brevundimonas sp. Leaf363]|uniref:DUF2975 domain-containing protein n=1 Tax=Brevundimonas sp. Leaf363 TaxID=1736353 RepID=UPI0006FFE6B5|nr:DUF2975 domain-containing protein [Brevundimonas sp. Leaf363]KQS54084.1 hypothetical protein ASG17_13325 [Brevundimonas sp. Leaf363]
MRLIGRRSVASVMRWVLGFVNVFVAIGAVLLGLAFLAAMFVPDFAAGLMDGLTGAERDPSRAIMISERMTYAAAFVASVSTWWIINRLRRIFLAVNQGDAFEPANVGRLQGVGVGLLGVQVASAIIAFSGPAVEGAAHGRDANLGAWLGILIVFMLAEVFRQGSTMRDEQQMTV